MSPHPLTLIASITSLLLLEKAPMSGTEDPRTKARRAKDTPMENTEDVTFFHWLRLHDWMTGRSIRYMGHVAPEYYPDTLRKWAAVLARGGLFVERELRIASVNLATA